MLGQHHFLSIFCYYDSKLDTYWELAWFQNVCQHISNNIYLSTMLRYTYSFNREIMALVLPIAHKSITFSIVRALTETMFINLLCSSIILFNSAASYRFLLIWSVILMTFSTAELRSCLADTNVLAIDSFRRATTFLMLLLVSSSTTGFLMLFCLFVGNS